MKSLTILSLLLFSFAGKSYAKAGHNYYPAKTVHCEVSYDGADKLQTKKAIVFYKSDHIPENQYYSQQVMIVLSNNDGQYYRYLLARMPQSEKLLLFEQIGEHDQQAGTYLFDEHKLVMEGGESGIILYYNQDTQIGVHCE